MSDDIEAYWEAEGLQRYFALYEDKGKTDPFHATSGKAKQAFAPQLADLVRLHRLVRSRMAATVLEFGVGFSTVIIADALARNAADFAALADKPRLRNSKPFHLYSVDASRHWLAETQKRIPAALKKRVTLSYSGIEAGTYRDQLCHYYKTLPNVVPDFIYLDGPSPKDVKGKVRGLDFSIDERTVMAADILLMEPTLLPGAFIIVDGRVNNARFLQRNFTRNFVHEYSAAGDITTFTLDEPPLGRHSHNLAALVAKQRKG